MFNLLRKKGIGEALDAQIAKFLDTDEGAEGLAKRLLISTSFMGPIATLVTRKPDMEGMTKNTVPP